MIKQKQFHILLQRLFPNLYEDTKAYIEEMKGTEHGLELYFKLFLRPEWQAVAIYRYGKWVRKLKNPLLRNIGKFLYFLLFRWSEWNGVSIYLDSEIGKGFRVLHPGAVTINGKLGENCAVAQQVVIGAMGMGRGTPKLGNNVFIGSGAKVIGEITVGDNVWIGANAVVLKDVPSDCTVAGIPAKIVRYHNKGGEN